MRVRAVRAIRAIRAILLAVVVLCLAVETRAQTNDIVIADSTGNNCLNITPSVSPVELFVTGIYEGLGGLPVAEFRITGMPASWDVVSIPNPTANVVLGDVLGQGVDIAFPVCDPGQNSQVVLFTLQVTATTTESAVLRVEAHATPSNPNFACPVFGYYCGPVDTALCLPEGPRAILNDPAGCAVGTESTTWSLVKQRFR